MDKNFINFFLTVVIIIGLLVFNLTGQISITTQFLVTGLVLFFNRVIKWRVCKNDKSTVKKR